MFLCFSLCFFLIFLLIINNYFLKLHFVFFIFFCYLNHMPLVLGSFSFLFMIFFYEHGLTNWVYGAVNQIYYLLHSFFSILFYNCINTVPQINFNYTMHFLILNLCKILSVQWPTTIVNQLFNLIKNTHNIIIKLLYFCSFFFLLYFKWVFINISFL